MTDKKGMRKQALKVRDGLDGRWRQKQSVRITERILQSRLYQRTEIVLSYASFRSEVDTGALNRQVLEDNKKLYLPRTYNEKKKMKFFLVEEMEQLKEGYQGILEPEEKDCFETLLESGSISKENVLMLMPGVAFDEAGNRMGYGGGYYDRYLNEYGKYVTSAMIAFQEQCVSSIPVETCDRKPEYIITQQW